MERAFRSSLHGRTTLHDRSSLHDSSLLREQEALAAKLVAEISQLERWLDNQSRVENARGASLNVSLVPTIRALLATRRKLLHSLEPYL